MQYLLHTLDSTPTTILIVVHSLIIIMGFISNMGIGFAFATDKVREDCDKKKSAKLLLPPNLLFT